MFRAPNPFDNRVGHAAQRLASGGANCSTCSSCCSSVVTAVAVSVLSSRMVARALPAAEPEAPGATPVAHRGWRILMGALLPMLTVGVAFTAAATLADGKAPWNLLALLLLPLLWGGLQFTTDRNRRLRWKLALLIIIALPLLLVAEMAVWIGWVTG